jgi:hypothetical protein
MGFGEAVLILFSPLWDWRVAVWTQVQQLSLLQPELAVVSEPTIFAPFVPVLPGIAQQQPAFLVSARQ